MQKQEQRHLMESFDILRWNFYTRRVEVIFERQKHDEKIPKVRCEDAIETIKSSFPEATIKERPDESQLVKLNNSDFNIFNNSLISVKYIMGSYTISEIPNLIEFMKEIDRETPKWDKDFVNYVTKLDSEIMKRVSYSDSEIDRILSYRIKLQLHECRQNTGTGLMLQKELDETKTTFSHISIKTWEHCFIINRPDQPNVYGLKFCYTEVGIEQLRQIDRIVPIWIEKLTNALAKKKKTEEINRLSVDALVRHKMKSLGCEYQIKMYEKSLLLYVRLGKERMIKLTVAKPSVGTIKKKLETIEKIIKFTDEIPSSFRITDEYKHIIWTR